MKCDGCGKDVQCAQLGPQDGQVWLGYSCGCCLAWAKTDSSVSWRDVKPWAAQRRKQVTS